jgi:hypothetical protein
MVHKREIRKAINLSVVGLSGWDFFWLTQRPRLLGTAAGIVR